MPMYEYFCPACSERFDALRPMSKIDAPATCPAGHETRNRVLSLFAFSRSAGGALTALSEAGGCACGGACSCGPQSVSDN